MLGTVPVLVALLAAQDGREERPAVDPYTRGEADALAKAGYASLGPFLVGDGHTTLAVREALGDPPILWIETEHFRLGCSLDTYKVPRDAGERAKLKGELKELATRVPGVKPKATKLDPWLRAHLTAQRIERLFADFCGTLGVVPVGAASPDSPGAPLGTGDKLTVLVFQRESTLTRYTQTYCGARREASHLEYFPGTKTLLFAISADPLQGSDTDLHFALVHGLTQALALGIHGFSVNPPRWWVLGLARWFARRVDDETLLFLSASGDALPDKKLADWEALVLGRVEAEFYPDWPATLAMHDTEFDFAKHLVLWSRIDFLLAQEPDVRAKLVEAFHAPLPGVIDAGEREKQLAQRFSDGLLSATGMDLDQLDAAWGQWVAASYAKKGKKKKRR